MTRTAKQALTDSILRALEYLTVTSNERPLRTNVAGPHADEVPHAPNFKDFNAGVRAAERADDHLVVTGADVNGVAPAPSLNRSVINFLKKGFSR